MILNILLLWYFIIVCRICWEESKVGWPTMIYHRLIPYVITHLILSTIQLFYLIPLYIIGNSSIMKHMGYNFSLCLWLFWGEIEWDGLENIPTKPCIWVANHQSILDMAIMTLLPCKTPLVGTSKSSIKYVPAAGILALMCNTILITRKSQSSTTDFFTKGINTLKNGNSINIFPQGTRKYGYPPKPFKYGAFNLSTVTNTPILPYKITYETENGITIRVKFYKPLEIEGFTPSELMVKVYNIYC